MRIVASVLLAALAACQPAAPDPRGVDRDETLLTVSAPGRSETRPDEARFSLGVNTLAASAGEASRLNNEKMAKVAAALARFGIKPDAYAAAAGLKVARVLAIRDGGQAGGEPMMMTQDAMAYPPPPPVAETAAPPPFNPGVNTSTVSVRVDFALSN